MGKPINRKMLLDNVIHDEGEQACFRWVKRCFQQEFSHITSACHLAIPVVITSTKYYPVFFPSACNWNLFLNNWLPKALSFGAEFLGSN